MKALGAVQESVFCHGHLMLRPVPLPDQYGSDDIIPCLFKSKQGVINFFREAGTPAPFLAGKPSGATSSPLIGKLFDDQGERLTPSHAVKGNRRYRYYVSSNLMKGSARKSGQGWRVPALEIERNLAAAVAGILDERTAIIADIDKAGLGTHDITSLLAAAAEWSTRLRSEAEVSPALESLVDRAELHQDGIRLSIRLPMPTFGKPKASTATPPVAHASDTAASETAWD
jgi:hypothetical protein